MIIKKSINVQQYMPFKSICPLSLIMKGEDNSRTLFLLGGTGFFVYFPPYDDVYLVTANHCFKDNPDYFDNDKYLFAIPIYTNVEESKLIRFEEIIIAENEDTFSMES